MTKETTGRRFNSFAALGEALTPADASLAAAARAAAARKGWATRRANSAGEHAPPRAMLDRGPPVGGQPNGPAPALRSPMVALPAPVDSRVERSPA